MSLVIGQRAQRSATITPEHVRAYAALTGDLQPPALRRSVRGRHQVRAVDRAGRNHHRAAPRARRHGSARTGHSLPQSGLEIHGPGIHRRYDHGGGRRRRCPPDEASDATDGQGDAADGRAGVGRRGLVLHGAAVKSCLRRITRPGVFHDRTFERHQPVGVERRAECLPGRPTQRSKLPGIASAVIAHQEMQSRQGAPDGRGGVHLPTGKQPGDFPTTRHHGDSADP